MQQANLRQPSPPCLAPQSMGVVPQEVAHSLWTAPTEAKVTEQMVSTFNQKLKVLTGHAAGEEVSRFGCRRGDLVRALRWR